MQLLKVSTILLVLNTTIALSCTNMLYRYKNQYLVARNFDWNTNNTFVLINPIGEKRETIQRENDEKPLVWRAKYGSVTFNLATPQGTLLHAAVQGGMNQEGLVVSLLELSDAQFQTPSRQVPNINNTYLVQYWLDNFTSVKQAVHALKHLNVVTTWWNGKTVPIHYVLRDAMGNSAVVDYLNGKAHVYMGRTLPFRVITNTNFTNARQLAQNNHDQSAPNPLLSGYGSKARFLRGIQFLQHMPTLTSAKQAVELGFAALQDAAEPPDSPYPTVWSVVYNTKTLDMYYRTLKNSTTRELNLHELTFKNQCEFPIDKTKLNLKAC